MRSSPDFHRNAGFETERRNNYLSGNSSVFLPDDSPRRSKKLLGISQLPKCPLILFSSKDRKGYFVFLLVFWIKKIMCRKQRVNTLLLNIEMKMSSSILS